MCTLKRFSGGSTTRPSSAGSPGLPVGAVRSHSSAPYGMTAVRPISSAASTTAAHLRAVCNRQMAFPARTHWRGHVAPAGTRGQALAQQSALCHQRGKAATRPRCPAAAPRTRCPPGAAAQVQGAREADVKVVAWGGGCGAFACEAQVITS